MDLLNEGKQVGTLYHFTDIWSLLNILKTDTLKSSNKFEKQKLPTVSLTRDKLGDTGGVGGTGTKTVRISIDGDKLSNKYKITPYNYYSNYPDFKESEDEMEEIIQGDINNITNCVDTVTENTNKPNKLANYSNEIQKVNPFGILYTKKNRNTALSNSQNLLYDNKDKIKATKIKVIKNEKLEIKNK